VRDPEFHTFYAREFEGAVYRQQKHALVLAARKLARVIFGLLTRSQLYDGRGFGSANRRTIGHGHLLPDIHRL
jgi:hypothetical protein